MTVRQAVRTGLLTERNSSDGVHHDSRQRASARMPRQARLDAPGTPHHVILRGTRADGGRSRGPRKLPRAPQAVPRRHGATARGLHVGNCETGRESGATISPLSQHHPATPSRITHQSRITDNVPHHAARDLSLTSQSPGGPGKGHALRDESSCGIVLSAINGVVD